MVSLTTNRPDFSNDIAEEIRLFLGNVCVQVNQQPGDDSLQLHEELSRKEDVLTALCTGGGAEERCCVRLTDQAPLAVKRMEKRVMKIAMFRLMKRLYPGAATPWGSLTGIRPTKLMRELAGQGDLAGAERIFTQTFDVSPEKTRLAAQICRVQAPVIDSADPSMADVYIGIPFCRTRCLYCSFGSLLAKSPLALEEYLSYLKKDIQLGASILRESGRRVRACYFGGGTPTVLSAVQLRGLMEYVKDAYGGLGEECTVEAGRPDTIDREKLQAIRDAGAERVSVNPQTMRDDTLRRVGRAHTADDVDAAFHMARELGFTAINMDIIAGLPGESCEDVAYTLQRIGALGPDNLTVHTLAVKRSSRLHEKLGEYALPDAAEAEAMVRLGREAAQEMGMVPYYMYRQKYMQGNLENVGYARPDRVCEYNIDMMEETVSIMAHGAHSMTKRVYGRDNRIERVPSPVDTATYYAKLDILAEAKRRLFCD